MDPANSTSSEIKAQLEPNNGWSKFTKLLMGSTAKKLCLVMKTELSFEHDRPIPQGGIKPHSSSKSKLNRSSFVNEEPSRNSRACCI